MFLKENAFVNEYDSSNREVSKNDKMFVFVQYLPPYITEIVLILIRMELTLT